MFQINLELSVPNHSGVPANIIYELPNDIGVCHESGDNLYLRSIAGINLPYIILNDCRVNGIEVKRAFIEALNTIHCITNDMSNFQTIIGNTCFEVIGSSAPFPGMSPIGATGVYANPNFVYLARLNNGCDMAILKRNLISNGFRFKAFGAWYGVVNDTTVLDERQPDQQFDTNKVYGFVIDKSNAVFPINETGTIY
jgi:hypothetical protein